MNDWDLWKVENLENIKNVIIPLAQIQLAHSQSSNESFTESPKWEPLLRVLCQTMDSVNLIISPHQDRSKKCVSTHTHTSHSLHHNATTPNSKAGVEHSLSYSNSVSIGRKKPCLALLCLIYLSLPTYPSTSTQMPPSPFPQYSSLCHPFAFCEQLYIYHLIVIQNLIIPQYFVPIPHLPM